MNVCILGMLYHHKNNFSQIFITIINFARTPRIFALKITKIPPLQPLKKKSSYYIVIVKSSKKGRSDKFDSLRPNKTHLNYQNVQMSLIFL